MHTVRLISPSVWLSSRATILLVTQGRALLPAAPLLPPFPLLASLWSPPRPPRPAAASLPLLAPASRSPSSSSPHPVTITAVTASAHVQDPRTMLAPLAASPARYR